MELRKIVHKPIRALVAVNEISASEQHSELGSKKLTVHQKQLDREEGCCTFLT